MKIDVDIDKECKELEVLIRNDEMNQEVNDIIKKLSESTPNVIAGIKNDRVKILDDAEIIRIYAQSSKVYAITKTGEYLLKLRLYELEQRLSQSKFVRISHSEIINLNEVINFDLSFTGTIQVKLSNNNMTYVSRRYVSRIKKILGI